MIELSGNQVEIVRLEGENVDTTGRYSGYARLIAEEGARRVQYKFQCEFIPGSDFAEIEIDEYVIPKYRLYPIENDKQLLAAQKTLYGCLYRYVYSMVDSYAFLTDRREGFMDHFERTQRWGSGLWRFEDDLEGNLIDLDDEGYSTFDPTEDINEAATIEVENEWLRLCRNAFMRDKGLVAQSEIWADMLLL